MLDEPTNHLDFESINWLINYVKQYPHTVLFVTRSLFLNEIATRIVELDRGKLKSYPGNYEDYIAMRAENEVIEQNNKKNKRHFINKNLHGCVQAQKQERQNNKLELIDLMIWSQKFNLIIKR